MQDLKDIVRSSAAIAIAAFLATPLPAVELPEGPGKAELEKLCIQCHDIAKSVSLRQDRNGWGVTMTKMAAMGMKGTDEEMQAVLGYLEKNFPPEALPPININTARSIQIESRFSLKRSEAAAILKYRSAHGPFQSIEDLKKVPGIDFAKIEAKRDSVVF
jgi:competence protein ComEA